MKVVCACGRMFVLLLMLLVMTGVVWARSLADSRAAESNVVSASPEASIAVPVHPTRSTFISGTKLNYVGVYPADGKFRPPSKLDRFRSSQPWWTRGVQTSELRPREVPPSIRLRSIERVVEDFEPPAHAVNAVQQRSALREGGGGLVRLFYGRENVLQAPTYLTTDSKSRVIIADPALPAVHVLDAGGEDSFRIMGGPERRLRRPAGTAVDANDNIYVADSVRGMIFVYRPDGTFIRRLGELDGGEALFHAPTKIAIDRAAGHIYVLDGSRIFMLSLDGTVLNRVGKHRTTGGPAEFDNPSDLALTANGIIVLDAEGSRIQLMNAQLKLIRRVKIPPVTLPGFKQRLALSTDTAGNIYVTCPIRSNITIISSDGVPVGDFGARGSDIAQFSTPAGLWVDGQNRIFVADQINKRVQVFQIQYSSSQVGIAQQPRGR